MRIKIKKNQILILYYIFFCYIPIYAQSDYEAILKAEYYKSEFANIKKYNNQLKQQVDEVKNENNSLHKKVLNQKNKLLNLASSMYTLNSHLIIRKQELNTSEMSLDQYKKVNDKLKEQINQKEEMATNYKNELVKAGSTIKDLERELIKMKEEKIIEEAKIKSKEDIKNNKQPWTDNVLSISVNKFISTYHGFNKVPPIEFINSSGNKAWFGGEITNFIGFAAGIKPNFRFTNKVSLSLNLPIEIGISSYTTTNNKGNGLLLLEFPVTANINFGSLSLSNQNEHNLHQLKRGFSVGGGFCYTKAPLIKASALEKFPSNNIFKSMFTLGYGWKKNKLSKDSKGDYTGLSSKINEITIMFSPSKAHVLKIPNSADLIYNEVFLQISIRRYLL